MMTDPSNSNTTNKYLIQCKNIYLMKLLKRDSMQKNSYNKVVVKFLFLIVAVGTISAKSSFALTMDHMDVPNPLLAHLPLDLTGAEYRALYTKLNLQHTSGSRFAFVEPTARLNKILDMGKRNLDWLKYINENKANPLQPNFSFSSAATQKAYPIESPKAYNETIVLESFQTLLAQLPPQMKSVLVDGAPFTKEIPIEITDYLKFGLAVDDVYQSAARWLMMKPYLDYLAQRKTEDIRGFYYFSKLTDLEAQLKNFKDLPGDQQKAIRTAFHGMCLNNGISDQDCDKKINDNLEKSSQLNTLYSELFVTSQSIYESFFEIPGDARRSEVRWDHTGSESTSVPFKTVNVPSIESFLKVNIEDEWKWKDWSLHLLFKPDALVHMEFEPGATPHVNAIGGDTITMDANSPLTEYAVQWTIRHEFGHVLGFPDCYIEFYDKDISAMVSYQIDTTDLMCSRRGHLKERHFQELKRIYDPTSNVGN